MSIKSILFAIMFTCLSHSSEYRILDLYKGKNAIIKMLNRKDVSDSVEILYFQNQNNGYKAAFFDSLYKLSLNEIFRSRLRTNHDSIIMSSEYIKNKEKKASNKR